MKTHSVLSGALLMALIFAVAEVGLVIRNFRIAQAPAQYNASIAAWNVRKASAKLPGITRDAEETVKFARKTMLNVDVVVARFKVATHSWEAANNAQAGYFEKIKVDSAQTIGKLNTLADSLNTLVHNSDTAINTDLLPQTTDTIKQAGEAIKTLNGSIVEASTGANVALQDIHALLKDPAITEALASISASSKHIEGTTASAEKSAGYIEGYLSPKKAGFWAKLIQFFVPKFSIDLK